MTARSCRRPSSPAAAFTLVELLITVSIVAIMATMMLFALNSAQETAKTVKTKALIAKIDAIIRDKWEAYRTRRVPIAIPSGTPVKLATQMRLDGLRELMRLELPDCWTDVTDAPITLANPPSAGTIARPSVSVRYLANYMARLPSAEYQGAECLYMIVMNSPSDDDVRETFHASDFGDIDNDGFPEFVDAWNHPLRFIRWPVGFVSNFQPLDANGNRNPVDNHDPFDSSSVYTNAYATYPLIYSAGPNGVFGIQSSPTVDSSGNTIYPSRNGNNNDPFAPYAPNPTANPPVGTTKDFPMEPNFVTSGWLDNIHNHMNLTR